MSFKNGETQEARGRFDTSRSEDQSKGLGCFRGSSKVDGNESVRTNKKNSSRENTPRSSCKQGGGTVGKIMQRLSLIEDAFLLYVRGNQQKLQATLDESKSQEENFLDIINCLKQDVYDFVSSDLEEDKQK